MREQQGEAGEVGGRGELQQGEKDSDGPMSSSICNGNLLVERLSKNGREIILITVPR